MLDSYRLLKGKILKDLEEHHRRGGDRTHYNLIIEADGTEYQVNIDTQSTHYKPNVKMLLVEGLKNKILSFVDNLSEEGLFELDKKTINYHIDYIRSNIIKPEELSRVEPKPHEEWADMLDKHVSIGDTVFCWGDFYDDRSEREHMPHGLRLHRSFPDKLPARGLHDIHLNQGTPVSSPLSKYNGTYQDGAFLIAKKDSVIGIFFAFDKQLFRTDDRGNPI